MVRRSRLTIGVALYGGLALLAGVTLSDWRFRATVWVVLAGLALKTWVGERMRR